jgi:SAM-dependent MidA family methyltransferase
MLDLPVPDADALAQSSRLVSLIEHEIAAAGGWITFHRYMELALYAPDVGYYSSGAQKFGKGGDFITAPELTPLFGQTLAAQVAEVMRASHPAVIEAGAGSGVLAADLLRELERLDCLPEFYGIFELSAQLRARQQQTLAAIDQKLLSRVVWLDVPPETFSGVLVGNEVLDAIAPHVVVARRGELFERGVTSEGAGAFGWVDRPARGAVLEAARKLPLPEMDGGDYVTEINLAAAAWIADWAARLQRGALLLFDYGYPRDEYYLPSRSRGTLMCHYRHRAHENPFLWPGLNDITSSVDFTAMAEAGFDAGLDVLGYTSQGEFLLNCGLIERTEGCGANGSAYTRASTAAQKLIQPCEMGELFKVLALGRGIDVPSSLMGFVRGDRTHRL